MDHVKPKRHKRRLLPPETPTERRERLQKQRSEIALEAVALERLVKTIDRLQELGKLNHEVQKPSSVWVHPSLRSKS